MNVDERPLVAVIMGSQSDWSTMKLACDVLDELGVAYIKAIMSAHRTPARLIDFAKMAHKRGFQIIIAGAGGAAHLPGMTAALTHLPVIGVPVQSKALNGQDSLLSIVQMPPGIPVGTMAIGGAKNAGLYAAQILSLGNSALKERLLDWRMKQSMDVNETVEE